MNIVLEFLIFHIQIRNGSCLALWRHRDSGYRCLELIDSFAEIRYFGYYNIWNRLLVLFLFVFLFHSTVSLYEVIQRFIVEVLFGILSRNRLGLQSFCFRMRFSHTWNLLLLLFLFSLLFLHRLDPFNFLIHELLVIRIYLNRSLPLLIFDQMIGIVLEEKFNYIF